MLFLVGLGLGDERDISLRGLEVVKSAKSVWLEAYTSVLPGLDAAKLGAFYGREVRVADRERVEQGCQPILEEAATADVAVLVVGDPFGATTHTDLWLRAKKMGVPVEVVHNASIMNAVGACGLSLYRFGQTVSIPRFEETWRPDSFYDKIKANLAAGLHTLCLLDIKVKEPNIKAMERGKIVYEPPYFMSVSQAVQQLLEVEEKRKEGVLSPATTLCVALARVGCKDQRIVAGTLQDMLHADMGPPLHSLVIAGEVQTFEEEALAWFRVGGGASAAR